MIEAGHRCAIPMCRAVAPLQIDHIVDWAQVQRHEFENMIVLCANCHGLKTNGHIDRLSLRRYKANLAVINSRYGDLERRALEYFAEQRERHRPIFDGQPDVAPDWPRGLALAVPGTMRLLMMYLVHDGYVELVPGGQRLLSPMAPVGSDWIETERVPPGVLPTTDYYRLTRAGVEFLDAWLGAQPIDGMDDSEVAEQIDGGVSDN